MLFLQAVEPASKLIEHSFNISPDTIFGLMTVGMLVIILALASAIVYQNKRIEAMRDKFEVMAQSMATVVVNNANVVTLMKDEIRELKEELKAAESRVVTTVKEIKPRLR